MIVLKIILWVIIAVLLLVVLLLSIPVGADIEYTDKAYIRLRYGFISVPLDRIMKLAGRKPKKPKKKKKKKEPQKPKQKKKENTALTAIKKLLNEKGLSGILSIISRGAQVAGDTSKYFIRHVKLRGMRVNITVATGDAADTAIKYGYVCAAVYPALSIVLNTVKYDAYSVNITTDFDKDKCDIDCGARVTLVPWFAVFSGVKALVGIAKMKTDRVI